MTEPTVTHDQLSQRDKAFINELGGGNKTVVSAQIVAVLNGNGNAAIYLSQLLWWGKRKADADGWFFRTRDQMQEKCGLGKQAQRTAEKTLKALDLIETDRRGMPAKKHYRIHYHALISLFSGDEPDPAPRCKGKARGVDGGTSSGGYPPEQDAGGTYRNPIENNTESNTESNNGSDPAGSGGTPPELPDDSEEAQGEGGDQADTEALTTSVPPTQHIQPPSEPAIREYVSAPDSLGDQNWRAAVIFTDLFDPGGDPGEHISRLINEANRMLGGETPDGRPIDKPESRVQVALAASLLYNERSDLTGRETQGGREDQPQAALNVISRKISEELETGSSSGVDADEDHPFADLHKEKMGS